MIRLSKSSKLSFKEKHPCILPNKAHLSRIIIHHFHAKCHHQGRTTTLAALREAGFWIIGVSRMVKEAISKCIPCRKLRSPNMQQQMGDLPKERIEPSPPFTNIGVDCFGPYLVKDYRVERKKWGLILTCMYSRAVHIELLDAMTADAFLNALRSFICIRGPVNTIFCDRGTNFVGANNELSKELEKTDNNLRKYMEKNRITFQFNPPSASHTGGVWERQIKTIKSILQGMATPYTNRLDSAGLRTSFYEAMASINSHPISFTRSNPHPKSSTNPQISSCTPPARLL